MQQKRPLLALIIRLFFASCLIMCLAYQAQHLAISSTQNNTIPTTPSQKNQQDSRWKAVLGSLWERIASTANRKSSTTPTTSLQKQENSRWKPVLASLWGLIASTANKESSMTLTDLFTKKQDDSRLEAAIASLREVMTSTFDSNLRDTLMMACAEGNTSGLTTMIKFLETQPKAFQRTILTRVDINRRNALSHACRCSRNDTVAKDLLHIIQRQDKETQKAILAHRDINGDNALMHACKHHQKESVGQSVLDIIKQQDKETQKAILTAKKENKATCLCAHVAREHGHEKLAKAIQDTYDQLNKKQIKLIINDNVVHTF